MTTTVAPSRAELVGRATDLVELCRKHAMWQEEHQIMHEDVMRGIRDAGLLKMRTPARYGGYESDARTVCDVVAELGRADGSHRLRAVGRGASGSSVGGGGCGVVR